MVNAAIAALPTFSGPAAWHADEMRDPTTWTQMLSEGELAELKGALDHARQRDVAIIGVNPKDFPLPTLGPRLVSLRDELIHTRGFVLLRGLPVDGLDPVDRARLFCGIGSYLGKAVSQNAKGHILGHVADLGRDFADPSTRIYQTTQRQTFHTDSCDIVSLLCLKMAKSGGLSSLVSSVALYNEMVRRRPDLAALLCGPFAVDRRNEVPAGMQPYFMLPVFHLHDGLVTTIYARRYIDSAQRFPDAPRLTADQIEALDFFDTLAEDPAFHIDMELRPGDLQFVHNHTILHDRTEYEDWPEPARRRHLLRLWLCPPNGRPLPAAFAARYGSVEIGNRGGIMVPGTRLTVPLEPE